MSTTSAPTADDILAREYERLRDDVLGSIRGRLRARGIALDDADLDAFYNQAWHALYDRLAAGEDVENPPGFLVTVGYRRAIEELRRLRPDTRADAVELDAVGIDHDVAARLDDTIRVRQLVEGMKERLDERECKAATLCLIHGYTRPEAADALGETPKRMEKVMDRVQRKLAVLTADIAGGDWCRSRRSMIKAYALGLLDHGGERYGLATQHLAGCAACRRYVNSTRGLAAVLPPVALPLGGAGTPALDRLNALAAAAWQHGGDLLGGHLVETGAAAAGAGAALAHGGGAAHGGPGAIAAKVAGVCAVSAVCVAGALAAAGALDRSEPPPPAARAAPTPAATVAATTPVPAATAKPAKPKRAAKRKPKRAKPRAAATATAVATPPPVVTPAPVITRAPAPVATPKATIVTDAEQEFGN